MGKGDLTYFDMAEDDYLYLQDDFARGRVGNLLCHSSQVICERYLKYVIAEECQQDDITSILKTHSLKRLAAFIERNVPHFECDFDTVARADGYYFSARYPGEDAIIVTKRDVDGCCAAVAETRNAVLRYRQLKLPTSTAAADISQDDSVAGAIQEFQNFTAFDK